MSDKQKLEVIRMVMNDDTFMVVQYIQTLKKLESGTGVLDHELELALVNKLDAIKKYRQRTGLGLFKSKVAIENALNNRVR